MNTAEKLFYLEKYQDSVWGERIVSELLFLHKMLQTQKKQDPEFDKAVHRLYEHALENDGISKSAVFACEEMLSHLSAQAKEYQMICVGHAHIDMNWMWDYSETVSITLNTFRTMLDLLNEYPQFTFSQSQASTYEIVEEFDPAMLEEIRQRVAEGRWEVTASTWVETDKNMPNGESLARHILYTKRYLQKLLGVDPKKLNLDFEPDTFGHNANVPEILNQGGVKYYYHCRGKDVSNDLFRWQSPSGSSILVYREPSWYIYTICGPMISMMPEFCKRNHTKTMLKVYGVGDHGGGPTRRDIEKIMEIAEWPLSPSIRFGTYQEFFTTVEQEKENFPVENGELNFLFTGCYTSQSRIKMANRLAEDRLYEAETLGTLAHISAGCESMTSQFEKAWRNTLFNHFHDILPGSGIIDTREYALGQFQKTMAYTNTARSKAIREIAKSIDTRSIAFDNDRYSISEGAGVGIPSGLYQIPESERGHGKTRVFHIFNATQYERNEVVPVHIWDWNYDRNRLCVTDQNGNTVKSQILDAKKQTWGHNLMTVAIEVSVPAFGYATYVVTQAQMEELPVPVTHAEREQPWSDTCLENDRIRAEFDPQTMRLISLVDKKSGKELCGEPSCMFQNIQENPINQMTAWINGEPMQVTDLNCAKNVKILERRLDGILQWITYQIKFAQSALKVSITLSQGSPMLEFGIECDWHELGSSEVGIPQLAFTVPFQYSSGSYRYDIPFGSIDRPAAAHDVPANSFCCALSEDADQPVLQVISDSKYGFMGNQNAISVDLIRSSFDPDPYPEFGIHRIRLGVAVCESAKDSTLFCNRSSFVHPLAYTTGTCQEGELGLGGSFLTVDGDAVISAVKLAEEKPDTIVLRLSACKDDGNCTITFPAAVSSAFAADINETAAEPLSVNNRSVIVPIKKQSVATIIVTF